LHGGWKINNQIFNEKQVISIIKCLIWFVILFVRFCMIRKIGIGGERENNNRFLLAKNVNVRIRHKRRKVAVFFAGESFKMEI
jgi:hypothetical protein